MRQRWIDLTDDENEQKYTDCFARRIGIKTVAEFVSDEKILQTIKEIGISCAQGYHIGKPETLV